jgi:hypothetical protein
MKIQHAKDEEVILYFYVVTFFYRGERQQHEAHKIKRSTYFNFQLVVSGNH